MSNIFRLYADTTYDKSSSDAVLLPNVCRTLERDRVRRKCTAKLVLTKAVRRCFVRTYSTRVIGNTTSPTTCAYGHRVGCVATRTRHDTTQKAIKREFKSVASCAVCLTFRSLPPSEQAGPSDVLKRSPLYLRSGSEPGNAGGTRN